MSFTTTATDGNFDVAKSTGDRRWSAPLPDNKLCMFEQTYMQLSRRFLPATLGTPDISFPDYFLVQESPTTDIGGGLCTWTRTYARVPDTRDEFETYVFKYPGYIGQTVTQNGVTISLTEGGGTQREPFTVTVNSRLAYKYFAVGITRGITTPKDIPVYERFQVYQPVYSGASDIRGLVTEYLGATTNPTASTYYFNSQARTITATPNAFSPNEISVKGTYELVAEDSNLKRWMGNIYERVTRYVPVL